MSMIAKQGSAVSTRYQVLFCLFYFSPQSSYLCSLRLGNVHLFSCLYKWEVLRPPAMLSYSCHFFTVSFPSRMRFGHLLLLVTEDVHCPPLFFPLGGSAMTTSNFSSGMRFCHLKRAQLLYITSPWSKVTYISFA
jgi:hypothetical protein